MLIADAELADLLKLIGVGSAGTVLTFVAVGLGVYFRFRKQLIELWNLRTVAASEAVKLAATAEAEAVKVQAVARAEAVKVLAEASATPIEQWRVILGEVRRELADIKAENHECHVRARRQQAELDDQQAEIDKLKRQNAGQQKELDATKAVAAASAAELARSPRSPTRPANTPP
jgi:hypothetical protein